ncbi:hypothetical protein [Vibrio aquimaris]|nr:hypothetical protein [Vibrio aquimaris]
MSIIAMSTTEQGPNNAFRCARVGQIKQVHSDNKQVLIDFEGNPTDEPIWASTSGDFTSEQFELAIDNQLDCKIEFMNMDPSLPILKDILVSCLDRRSLTLKAETMVLEGTKEVTVKSQDTFTHYNGRSGRVTTQAETITTEAVKSHKIKARKINLN